MLTKSNTPLIAPDANTVITFKIQIDLSVCAAVQPYLRQHDMAPTLQAVACDLAESEGGILAEPNKKD
jgi:hypothetical protein